VYVWFFSTSWDAYIHFLLTLLVYRVAAPCRWALRDGTVPSSVQLCSRRLESRPKKAMQMPAWQLAWEEPNTLNEDQIQKVAEWYKNLDPEEQREDVPVEELWDHNR
jgi:hypothetical protein